MLHLFLILGFAVLCGLWAALQLADGQQCRGCGACSSGTCESSPSDPPPHLEESPAER